MLTTWFHMTQLYNLVYVSSAVRPPTEAELRHLLQRAQERNRTQGVTGVLLFDAGNFMQYIEVLNHQEN